MWLQQVSNKSEAQPQARPNACVWHTICGPNRTCSRQPKALTPALYQNWYCAKLIAHITVTHWKMLSYIKHGTCLSHISNSLQSINIHATLPVEHLLLSVSFKTLNVCSNQMLGISKTYSFIHGHPVDPFKLVVKVLVTLTDCIFLTACIPLGLCGELIVAPHVAPHVLYNSWLLKGCYVQSSIVPNM